MILTLVASLALIEAPMTNEPAVQAELINPIQGLYAVTGYGETLAGATLSAQENAGQFCRARFYLRDEADCAESSEGFMCQQKVMCPELRGSRDVTFSMDRGTTFRDTRTGWRNEQRNRQLQGDTSGRNR